MKSSAVHQCTRGTTACTMIHYFLAHTAYHLSRCLPHQDRCRLLVIELLLGIAILALQVYVLMRPSSSRYCSQPLLNNLVCQIGFTVCSLGFASIFTRMEYIPWGMKFFFHTFGVSSLLEGICTAIFTGLATQCAHTTPELYWLSLVYSVVSAGSTAFFVIIVPFWLVNTLNTGLVLNKSSRTGACYEPVACCHCLWYI